jgi:alkyl hydroperoxide reductase subunit AhpC
MSHNHEFYIGGKWVKPAAERSWDLINPATEEKFADIALGSSADVDKAVAASYGVLGPLGFYRRSVFVIDGGGIIRYAKRSFTGLTFEPTAALLAAVAGAGGTRPAPR